MSKGSKDRAALASAGPPIPQPTAFTPELRAQTGPRSGWSGRLREASAERTVLVDRSVEDVLPHLWKIKNVEFCERKADKVIVTPESPSTGCYLIRGRIFGLLPWSGQFHYVLHESGFHSEDAAARRGGLKVNGGFTAEQQGGQCRIWHYERYLLPWPAAPLKPLVSAYVAWTQRREMRDLATLIAAEQDSVVHR